MKLTDEQGEEIRARNERVKQIKAKYRLDAQPSNKELVEDSFELKHLTDKLNDDVETLLSSEQAWKEEAEEAKRVTMEVSAALVESTMQLNQVKELLKQVREIQQHAIESIAKKRENYATSDLDLLNAVINTFLSSLGEK